ncbi:hypothetical protein HCH52_09560 [Oscillospiraceae bacterium HV4-5-C5C]|nr:hypothetical protein [Oscillospiraceae bacterium HV4-5-C5C]
MKKWFTRAVAFTFAVLLTVAVLMLLQPDRVYAADNNYGITIDGDMSDWSDKPMTDISFSWDTYNIKQGSLLADDNNIYFFIDMAPLTSEDHQGGYAVLQTSSYKLTVGSKVFWINVDNTFAWAWGVEGQSRAVNLSIWAEDNSLNGYLPGVEAYMYRKPMTGGYSDQLECLIPLSALNLQDGGSQTITLSNQNLGQQTLTATGGNTGATLLVVAALGLATYAVIRLSRKASRA